jgi:hypothetical protein
MSGGYLARLVRRTGGASLAVRPSDTARIEVGAHEPTPEAEAAALLQTQNDHLTGEPPVRRAGVAQRASAAHELATTAPRTAPPRVDAGAQERMRRRAPAAEGTPRPSHARGADGDVAGVSAPARATAQVGQEEPAATATTRPEAPGATAPVRSETAAERRAFEEGPAPERAGIAALAEPSWRVHRAVSSHQSRPAAPAPLVTIGEVRVEVIEPATAPVAAPAPPRRREAKPPRERRESDPRRALGLPQL